jgi:hypothetical protein
MVQSARKDTVFADEARHIAEEAVARPTALHTTGPGAHHFVLAQLRRNVLKEEVAVGSRTGLATCISHLFQTRCGLG